MPDEDGFGGMSGKYCHGDVSADCNKCRDPSCSRVNPEESLDTLLVDETT